MDSRFSASGTMKRTPQMRRDLTLPHIVWGDGAGLGPAAKMRAPLHSRFVGFGATLLIGAFATDLAYARSELFQWENLSVWLITAGLVLAAVAAVILIFDLVAHRIAAINWLRFWSFTGAVLLSILNVLVHSRDAYTAVVPQGVILSGIVAAILLALGWWRGWSVGNAPQSSIGSDQV
ncbi:MAG TPA: DUF2231 domain-containing protein [Rhizomicrobium sp.]|jgi:uncharacterized membrane protein